MAYRYKALKVHGRRVDEHRYVMEQHLGRYLKTTEIVRHKDGDTRNNKLDNLYIVTRQEQVKDQITGGNFHKVEYQREGGLKGGVRSRELFGKKIMVSDKDGNDLIILPSVRTVIQTLKAATGHVHNVLRGYNNCKTVKGFRIRYYDPTPLPNPLN